MAKILIAVPSSGMISEGTAVASFQGSLHLSCDRVPSSASGPNFNRCWTEALNEGMAGTYTHFVMFHADIGIIEDPIPEEKPIVIPADASHQDRMFLTHLSVEPMNWRLRQIYADHLEETGRDPTAERARAKIDSERRRCIDTLVEEMEQTDADFLSVPVPMKDDRGVVSCGIGDPADPWVIWRKFTVRELARMPETFCAADIGYGDKYLLHNHAVCIWDMRKPIWYEARDGQAPAVFNFSERIIRQKDGKWKLIGQSEDWAFSRLLWKMKARTFITRKIKVHHLQGHIEFPNYGDWGTYTDGDRELEFKWRATDPFPALFGERKSP